MKKLEFKKHIEKVESLVSQNCINNDNNLLFEFNTIIKFIRNSKKIDLNIIDIFSKFEENLDSRLKDKDLNHDIKKTIKEIQRFNVHI